MPIDRTGNNNRVSVIRWLINTRTEYNRTINFSAKANAPISYSDSDVSLDALLEGGIDPLLELFGVDAPFE